MRRKTSKRSTLNKTPRSFIKSSSPAIDTSTIPRNQVDFGIGTVHLDSHVPCLKANLELRNQKILKRDLLRCSDQRPSLLGSHTLQPPRMHHGYQSTNNSTSLSAGPEQTARRHSLSTNSRALYATIDRIGPWPDISISRLRSDGNELLRPLKNFRSLKNPRVFSPKYYAALTENTSKFKFYSSTRNYIDEYRKQKGYSLNPTKPPQISSPTLSMSLNLQQTEEDQGSVSGVFSSAIAVDIPNSAPVDRPILSTTELPPRQALISRTTHETFDHLSTPPSIPAVTKVYYDAPHVNNLPTIPMRNGHLRPTRPRVYHANIAQQSPHQQSIALPSVAVSSLQYISSMNSIEKTYASNKKSPGRKQPKLFFFDDRNRKRLSQRFNSDSEISNRSQDFSELQATGTTVMTSPQRSSGVVVYQLSRRSPPIATN